MTTYRFRVKHDPDSTGLWRDVVVRGNRALTEFQRTVNDAMGLDRGHLWFIGAGEAYWNSEIKFQSPREFDESGEPTAFGVDETAYDAGETTVDEMVDRLDLDERDRVCYLYDYGDEWRFYLN
ncbi:plasmid pRiA4b ORF-3 family protein [Halorubrum rutilum]|uniref:Plasmid pRiA4b ORF-3 family protein n=1 Tax=Halorubrum rutilum TaxID=1364933 RepID=A0ABD6AIT4_9EURY|nr:plasmid pRiA4b ORF-3 family protein [Halorubrum rutilum]